MDVLMLGAIFWGLCFFKLFPIVCTGLMLLMVFITHSLIQFMIVFMNLFVLVEACVVGYVLVMLFTYTNTCQTFQLLLQ